MSNKPFVIVCGGSSVGKTNLIHRVTEEPFVHEHIATVEDDYETKVIVQGNSMDVTIKDTSGEFAAFREAWIRVGKAFVLVYSVADPNSFNEVAELRAEIVKSKGEGVPHVLVGTKSDLAAPLRKITTAEGQAKANEWGCPFFECSAKDDVGCLAPFEALLQQPQGPVRQASNKITNKQEGRMSNMCIVS
eukprot:TRINITY_DN1376_c0_g1_i1.p1 TRINITY_DN1376_c0_g1~~TRINITY_DN1376_c0_g1_i1.p1  ORF type:complete len:190 (+),score=47.45 TRINITY_DN1376_c0_g1_i1:72-641(+)